MRESAQKGERSEPQHGELQYTHSAESIRQDPRTPTADGGRDQGGARDVPRLSLSYTPHGNQARNDEGVNHEIEAVQAVARIGGQHRSAFIDAGSLQPHG